MTFRWLWNCVAGPRVYAVFSMNPPVYPSNSFESLSDLMLTFIHGVRHICATFSPLLVIFAYRNSMVGISFAETCVKFVSIYFTLAYGFRFFGRLSNPEYKRFSDVLSQQKLKPKDLRIAALLAAYDFETFAFPLAFRSHDSKSKLISLTQADMPPEVPFFLRPIREIVAYLCANTFGRRMVYPGATAILQTLFFATILENRRKLIVNKKGLRAVIGTADLNRIDTIFFDRRREGEKGDTLVLTCEGNAAFYETGIVNTPLSLGYSVLGWNAPGFAGSSGQPTPSQIVCAIDAVMQYATVKLGFLQNQIVIYAWSIGGFPATWAAANYPNIQGLVLDATFDDLLPLALARMPASLENIIHYTVRKHLDLPVGSQLALYKGPVILIRRWRDELLVTLEHGSEEERRASNRANELLKVLIRSRHPKLIDGYEEYVDAWLAADDYERSALDTWKGPILQDFEELDPESRISLIYHICSRYLLDFDSEHNTPLDPILFTLPAAL